MKSLKVIAPVGRSSNGFTLVELLVTMAISMVIVAAIFSTYLSQQKTQLAQHQVVEMQQNLRALMTFLSSEIRLAGYDPDSVDNIGIIEATKNTIRFTWDSDGNGITSGSGDNEKEEDIEYGFAVADDADGDGQADSGAASFCRRRANVDSSDTGFESLADNIVAVEFLYVMEDTNSNSIYDPETTLSPAASEFDDIRAVTISLLARAGRADSDFLNTFSYTTASGVILGPYNDNYRRRMLVTKVKLRNSGL
ncbi:PilW family protein [Desulfosediminicola flagellatus]|uniref:PilW family protein n=1 Tax=Desulfosediminicola flagellatus TaxID=2569541 RepID=UPI00142EBAE4|nr:PilW family protein [Desulfosediminicola flagellatus]